MVKAFVLLLALALPAAAAAGPPEAALAFLEKVRIRKVNLEPDGDTALSAHTQDDKRREITRRLERTALDLEAGTLESAADRTDGDLAAVIVRKTGGFDPARLRVIAVALVRKNGEWRPAPVPASFENTGIGFAPDIRKRARDLEQWMLEQQSQMLDVARDQVTARMRGEILSNIRPDDVRAMTAVQAGARFLDACAKPALPVILGLLGGLQANLPDDWSGRLQHANAAAAAPKSATRPWRLLMAPDVLRTVVHEEGDEKSGQISLACIDPNGPKTKALPRIEIVHLKLDRSAEGIWQVNPPRAFTEGQATTSTNDPFHQAGDDEDEDDGDNDLLEAFPARLRQAYPLKAHPTFDAAVKALREAFLAPTPVPLLGLLDLTGPHQTATAGCAKAVAVWASLHDPAHVRSAVTLDSAAQDTTGAASFQFLSVRQDHIDLRVFYFEQGDEGWRLLGGMAPDDLCRDRFAAASEWAANEAKRWPETWRAKVLADTPVIDPAALKPAPGGDEVRKLVDAWFDALDSGDLAAALRLCARLGDKSSPPRLLRNLGYEVNSLRNCKVRPSVVTVESGKIWSAAVVRSQQGEKPLTAVYPVVTTPDGPRILLEADLFISAERGREFLNKSSFGHMRENVPEEVVADLESLFKRLAETPTK